MAENMAGQCREAPRDPHPLPLLCARPPVPSQDAPRRQTAWGGGGLVPMPVRGAATTGAHSHPGQRGHEGSAGHLPARLPGLLPCSSWGCPGRRQPARGRPPGTEQLWPRQPLPPSSPAARGPRQETAPSAHVPCSQAPLLSPVPHSAPAHSFGAGFSLPTRDHEPPPAHGGASGHCWNWVSSGLQVQPAALPRGG